jgi:hypothetical protein
MIFSERKVGVAKTDEDESSNKPAATGSAHRVVTLDGDADEPAEKRRRQAEVHEDATNVEVKVCLLFKKLDLF